jgi:two-component system, chemotaxis family, protein-glutamate methylesterase/glutaminase
MSRQEASNGVGRNIIVIGASAGGVQVLQELMRGLPEDFPGSVFVVVHTAPSSPGILPLILDRAGPLPAAHARNGERIRGGRVYVSPPDFHLLLKPGKMELTRGPTENGFRPAVDPLFRTAARAYGPRVVGIVLSGGLDDGTLGLTHIKNNGGIAVAQDPAEAVFPGMPASAIANAAVDHVLPVAEMPALLSRLASVPLPKGAAMSRSGNGRPDVAEAGTARLLTNDTPGPPTSVTCPDCGGSLWEVKDGKLKRFECHVGHSYTALSLMAEKDSQLEMSLWSALRALEENADLRRRMARRSGGTIGPMAELARRYERQADEAEQRAAVLREVLTSVVSVTKKVRKGKAQRRAMRSNDQSTKSNGNGKPRVRARKRRSRSA